MPGLAPRHAGHSVPERSNAARRAGLLALISAVTTYVLLVLGSTVRVTESGMGCPGWPLCYGQLGPTHGFHAVMEQSHRYLAAVVTIAIAATLVAAIRARSELPRAVLPAMVSAVIVVIQVILGAITVVAHNAPPTVAAHLVTGLLLAASTVVTAVATRTPAQPASGDPPRLLPGFRSAAPLVAVIALFLVMVSGSVVVDGNAARGCPAWPACSPPHGWNRFATIQMVHRGTVLVATVAILVALAGQFAARPSSTSRRALAWGIGSALAAQIVVGAATAILKAPDALQDVHLALASAVWMGLLAMVALNWYGPPVISEGETISPPDSGLSALAEKSS